MASSPPPPKVDTYYVGVQFVLCHGPIDKVTKILVGEKDAWEGNTTGGTITVAKDSLFGGLLREGGISGAIDIDMGEPTQAVNTYLSGKLGTIPAFRGLTTAVLNHVYMGTNYYLKKWWFVGTRIHKTYDGGAQWQDALSEPIPDLINGIHIIREVLTDPVWGMGKTSANIHEASFLASAQTCFDEGLGLAFLWDNPGSKLDFIKSVQKHVQGVLYIDRSDGLYHFDLIRRIENTGSLTVLDGNSIINVSNLLRKSITDVKNSVTVKYENNGTHKQDTVTVTDDALFAKTGIVNGVTNEYEGIATSSVAQKIALRDLAQEGFPGYSCSINTTRAAEHLNIGEAFIIDLADVIPTPTVMRVISINLGTEQKRGITIECVQDTFSAPTVEYQLPTASAWIDPINDPQDVSSAKIIETPYYEIARYRGDAEAQQVDSPETFMNIACSKPTPDSYDVTIASTAGAVFVEGNHGEFCANAILSTICTRVATQLQVTGITDWDLLLDNTTLQVGEELMKVVSHTTSTINVLRGVLDTIPEEHAIGEAVWCWGDNSGSDEVTYFSGETVKVKLLASTARGVFDLASATEHTVNMVGRLHKPYPAGNVEINGDYFPTTSTGGAYTITWATRNRLQQTNELLGYTSDNVTTEAGVVYDGELVRTDTSAVLDSFTGSSNTTEVLNTAYTGEVKLTVKASRSGVYNFQDYVHTFTLI